MSPLKTTSENTPEWPDRICVVQSGPVIRRIWKKSVYFYTTLYPKIHYSLEIGSSWRSCHFICYTLNWMEVKLMCLKFCKHELICEWIQTWSEESAQNVTSPLTKITPMNRPQKYIMLRDLKQIWCRGGIFPCKHLGANLRARSSLRPGSDRGKNRYFEASTSGMARALNRQRATPEALQ